MLIKRYNLNPPEATPNSNSDYDRNQKNESAYRRSNYLSYSRRLDFIIAKGAFPIFCKCVTWFTSCSICPEPGGIHLYLANKRIQFYKLYILNLFVAIFSLIYLERRIITIIISFLKANHSRTSSKPLTTYFIIQVISNLRVKTTRQRSIKSIG